MGRGGRREFLVAVSTCLAARQRVIALGTALCTIPLHAFPQAEPARRWRIGSLSPGPRTPAGKCVITDVGREFRDGLSELGLAEGTHYVFERRCSDADVSRLPGYARQLVAAEVDVIVAWLNESIAAAKAATNRIPIVMVYGPDPVAHGWAKSLSRPGSNLTGMTWELEVDFSIGLKVFELLTEMLPGVRRIAFLDHAGNPNRSQMERTVHQASTRLRTEIAYLGIPNAAGIEDTFRQARANNAEVLLLSTTSFMWTNRKLLMDLVAREKLPAIVWGDSTMVAEFPGALAYFGMHLADQPRRAAHYVARILKGARPSELPIERPTKIDLVASLKTARMLGITVPRSILLRADRVIE